MTIIEAIKSGKAFKRIGMRLWIISYGPMSSFWYISENDDDDDAQSHYMDADDILADDWIVREQ